VGRFHQIFVEEKQEQEKKETLDGLNQRFKPYLS
jgi:hypothetical protein